MPDKFAILRLTIKVDLTDMKEKSFVRVVLRRLNILFAKCRPKGAVIEILNGSKLSDAYDGSQKVGKSDKPKPKYEHIRAIEHYTYKPVEKPKPPEIIVEHSMQPPEIAHEILED